MRIVATGNEVKAAPTSGGMAVNIMLTRGHMQRRRGIKIKKIVCINTGVKANYLCYSWPAKLAYKSCVCVESTSADKTSRHTLFKMRLTLIEFHSGLVPQTVDSNSSGGISVWKVRLRVRRGMKYL